MWLRQTAQSYKHTVYNIHVHQQAATQGSNDMAHILSCRTSATTRFSTDARNRRRQVDQVGPAITSQAFTRCRHLIIALLVIYRPRKDERLSSPSW